MAPRIEGQRTLTFPSDPRAVGIGRPGSLLALRSRRRGSYDYDLQIQHNEAVNLAVEHIGVERIRTDSFFDGLLGTELVKIVAFDHPLTQLDLQGIEDELRARPQEERDIVVVALGKELSADAWLADYARRRRGSS